METAETNAARGGGGIHTFTKNPLKGLAEEYSLSNPEIPPARENALSKRKEMVRSKSGEFSREKDTVTRTKKTTTTAAAAAAAEKEDTTTSGEEEETDQDVQEEEGVIVENELPDETQVELDGSEPHPAAITSHPRHSVRIEDHAAGEDADGETAVAAEGSGGHQYRPKIRNRSASVPLIQVNRGRRSSVLKKPFRRFYRHSPGSDDSLRDEDGEQGESANLPPLALKGEFDFQNFKVRPFFLCFPASPQHADFLFFFPSNGVGEQIRVVEQERAFATEQFFPQVWFRIKLRYRDLPYEWTIRRSRIDLDLLYNRLVGHYLLSSHTVTLPPHVKHHFIHPKDSTREFEEHLHLLCALDHSPEAQLILSQFFGCSVTSFLPGRGQKPKEGFVYKHAGGRRQGFRGDAVFKRLPPFFHKKWLVIGESYVAYYDNIDTLFPKEVLLVDRYFEASFQTKRGLSGAMIENGYRKLFVTKPKQVEDFQSKLYELKYESEWSRPHRYSSFAPEREHIPAKFLIDGDTYYDDLATALEAAEETIFISCKFLSLAWLVVGPGFNLLCHCQAWWISPELYLKRNPTLDPKYRLDHLLKRKAEGGIVIYIMIFNEVPTVLPYDSEYTKNALKALHSNVVVVRHPSHNIASKSSTLFHFFHFWL